MPLHQIEIIVDRWPVGSRNEVKRKGERVLLDEKAAFILVGMGKAVYVGEAADEPRVKRRYNRRDMRAAD